MRVLIMSIKCISIYADSFLAFLSLVDCQIFYLHSGDVKLGWFELNVSPIIWAFLSLFSCWVFIGILSISLAHIWAHSSGLICISVVYSWSKMVKCSDIFLEMFFGNGSSYSRLNHVIEMLCPTICCCRIYWQSCFYCGGFKHFDTLIPV